MFKNRILWGFKKNLNLSFVITFHLKLHEGTRCFLTAHSVSVTDNCKLTVESRSYLL